METDATILLIDDSASDRHTYRRWLSKPHPEGQAYSIIECETGEEALEYCQTQWPDVLLIDYLLPDMTGLELLQQLRNICPSEKIPAIILTGQGSTKIAIEFLKNGAEDYLEKSQINEEILYRLVDGMLKRFQLLKQLREAEKEREDSRFLRQVLDNLSTFVGILSPEGYLLEANKPPLLVAGLRREEVIGQLFAETYWWQYDPVAPQKIRAAIAQARQGDKVRFDIPVQTIEGHLIQIDFFFNPIFNSQGQTLYIIASGVDISDRKQTEVERHQINQKLQLAKEQLELVIQASNDGFWDWDLTTNEIYYSPRWKEMLGYQDWELPNEFSTWEKLISAEELPIVYQLIEDYNSGKCKQFLMTQRFTHRNGSTVYIISQAIHIKDEQGKVVRMIGSHSDITPLMEVQKQLEASQQFLQSVTDQLAVKIEELEQRNQEMMILSEMNDFLQSCVTITEACQATITFIPALFPQYGGGIAILNASRNYLEVVSHWGNNDAAHPIFTRQDCWALRRGKLHEITERSQELRCPHFHTSETPLYSYCIPMLAQGEILGLLYLSSLTAVPLTLPKQNLAQAIAEQLSAVIANLMLREKLHHQSIRDPLTNLFNRRYLEEFLAQEISRATRQQYPISVIMLDVDYFKLFNDTLGHDTGDFVLREIGSLLQNSIRISDMACRYGGEEMTLILPEIPLTTVAQKAEAIREAIATLNLTYQKMALPPVTASLGVACFPEHGTTGRELLQNADLALYQAKAQGRNQVVIYGAKDD